MSNGFRLSILAFAALFPSIAFPHDAGCDGSAIPSWIKSSCCGKADAHILTPGEVRQDDQGRWHIRAANIEIVVPYDHAQPSQDGCYWTFFKTTADGRFAGPYDDGDPTVWCFLIPMAN